MINSKQKGARAERLLSHALNALLADEGIVTRRTAQYCGKTGEASDLVGIPGIHIESKHQERLNIYDAIDQAKRDARKDELPCVFHKKNRKEWLVTMPLIEWIKLFKAYNKAMK